MQKKDGLFFLSLKLRFLMQSMTGIVLICIDDMIWVFSVQQEIYGKNNRSEEKQAKNLYPIISTKGIILLCQKKIIFFIIGYILNHAKDILYG